MTHHEQKEEHLRRIDTQALWHPFTQMADYAGESPPPPIIVDAEGNWLIAQDGKRYLDANAGYWCLALGCRPKAVEDAVRVQLEKFSHSTLLGLSHVPALELAEKLVALAGPPFKHVFYADSGSEAVEAALKMAYQYQCHKGQPECSEFLALGEAYHGDTLGAVAAGGIELFHATFKPLLFPVRRVPPPHCYRCPWKLKPESCHLECAQALEAAIAEHHAKLAAVLIEPFVLGPGGIIPQPDGYLERVVTAARKHGVLVIFDEVAVGIGRLGTVFAFEQLKGSGFRVQGSGFRVQGSGFNNNCGREILDPEPGTRNPAGYPDLVCLAKGLTAGALPLSAVLATDEIYGAFLGSYEDRRAFFHGHTFTGSALGCAAALAALDEISSPAFLKTLQEKTIPSFWRMLEPLRAHPRVGSVRGRGMMAGIEVVRDRQNGVDYAWQERIGHAVALAARERGVNLRAIGNLVLAVPPLVVSSDEIALLGRVLAESISQATARSGEAAGRRDAESGQSGQHP